MKNIVITVRGSKGTNYGCYVGILEYNKRNKIVYKYIPPKDINDDITTNRLIILGCIECIKMLKEPCNIELNVTTATGINNTKYKSVNSDLTKTFDKLIVDAGHKLNVNVTRVGQSKLIRIVKKLK